jgi:uncharacterized protein (TIGR02284 family)
VIVGDPGSNLEQRHWYFSFGGWRHPTTVGASNFPVHEFKRLSSDRGTAMPATNESLDIVKELIETCRDGQNGYLHAASQVQDPQLKNYFDEQSLERGRFAVELEEASKRLGQVEASDTGTVAGVVHRAWFELKGDMGAGDHEILVSVEQGEDRAKKAYEDAINGPLPEMLLAIVREQYASVRAAHDRIRDWRDGKSAVKTGDTVIRRDDTRAA